MQPSHTQAAVAAPEEPQAPADITLGMQPAPRAPEGFPAMPPMLATGSQPPSALAKRHPEPPAAPRDQALFDHWLRRELGRVHDDVLREPIPDRLRWIIEGGGERPDLD